MAGFDWNALRRQIHEMEAGAKAAGAPTAEERLRILRQRARALAQPRIERVDEEFMEIVSFLLGTETYAVKAELVREVYPLKDLAPIPCTPPFVLGVINVRGEIRAVIELRNFFGMPEGNITNATRAVIVRSGEVELGLLADRIIGMQPIQVAQLQPPPSTFTGVNAEFLLGIAADQMVILDAVRIAADPRIVVQQQVQT